MIMKLQFLCSQRMNIVFGKFFERRKNSSKEKEKMNRFPKNELKTKQCKQSSGIYIAQHVKVQDRKTDKQTLGEFFGNKNFIAQQSVLLGIRRKLRPVFRNRNKCKTYKLTREDVQNLKFQARFQHIKTLRQTCRKAKENNN